jgi:hypothetical protein
MNSKDEAGSAATEAAKLPLSRLWAWLAIGVVTGALANSAEAAVVTFDIGPTGFNITGVNGGVTAVNPGLKIINNFPTTGGGSLFLTNNFAGTGLTGPLFSGGGFIAATGTATATPVNFAAGTMIDANAGGGVFTNNQAASNSAFKGGTAVSPDFGPNSFLGFKDALGRYGYIETTWDSTRNQFQFFSAAYESDAGVGIMTPGGAAVPEIDPAGMGSVLALVTGALGLIERRRLKAKIA